MARREGVSMKLKRSETAKIVIGEALDQSWKRPWAWPGPA
jgi:hypothetical protein